MTFSDFIVLLRKKCTGFRWLQRHVLAVRSASGEHAACGLISCGGMLCRRSYEGCKQRMWTIWTREKFGVELASQHEGVILDFGDFNQPVIGR